MERHTKGDSRADRAQTLLAHPSVQEAASFLEDQDDWTLGRQIELTAIPAPPYGEGLRAQRMAELLAEAGAARVRRDDAGNVLAEIPGPDCSEDAAPGPTQVPQRSRNREPTGPHQEEPAPPLILAAHLDTVFPRDTDTTPRWQGDRISAPGISDDGRGLAALLALTRVLVEIDLPLQIPVRIVATVGEEGPGNLRGVRHLFREDGEARKARGFISLDGVGLDKIIHRGVGSTRLRLELSGRGGHSWTDWGTPNPIHALARVVTRAQTLELSSSSRTTLTVARWGGGMAINAIPQRAWMELDLRSEGRGELEALERSLLEIFASEADGEPDPGERPGRLHPVVREIGRRPAGGTALSAPLVKAAVASTLALGETPRLVASSTDANVPMALGVPAITLGAGGLGGGTHTLDEWYLNEKGPAGILRVLLTALLLD